MVYIDSFNAKFRRMIMCHMGSPDLEELHKMAQAIGMKREWFQNEDGRHPHYDVCLSRKALALKLGAMEVGDRELIKLCYPKLNKDE